MITPSPTRSDRPSPVPPPALPTPEAPARRHRSEPASTSPNEPATPSSSQNRRALLYFTVLSALYGVGLLAMASQGHFGFVWKTVVVPTLLLVAALSGRARQFLRDWGPFLALLLVFDALRGLIFALVTRLELPFYASYVIDWERALLGGRTFPVLLQQTFLDRYPGIFEELLVVAHGSHFLVFLMFGFLIWLARRAAFGRFKNGLLILIGGGLIGYFLVPTVPPWMAHQFFDLLPPVRRVTQEIYDTSLPTLRAAFDVNPIAAMPSLHTAFPVYLSAVALHHFGRRGLLMLVYMVLVLASITYLGEHYLLDVLAGSALALSAYLVSHRAPPVRLAPRLLALSRARYFPAIATGLLLLCTEGIRLGTGEWTRALSVNQAFVERELQGRSRLASFYRGSAAAERGDPEAARAPLRKAMDEAPDPAFRALATVLYARAALATGHAPDALEAIERLPADRLAPAALALRIRILDRVGRADDADRSLSELAQRAHGDDAEAAYELALVERDLGRATRASLKESLQALEPLALNSPHWATRATEIRDLLERASP